VHVNFVTYTPVENNDKATICFNSNQQQIDKPDSNTFCFVQIMGKDSTHVLQGGGKLASTGFYKTIKNDLEIIGVGGISDKNDRYSSIPHESYEFKIPIDVIGRSNLYGFYVNVYVDKADKEYTWPKDVTSDRYPFIPQPNTWGKVVSLDNSIPEFPIPVYILVITLLSIIIFSKIKFQKIFQFR